MALCHVAGKSAFQSVNCTQGGCLGLCMLCVVRSLALSLYPWYFGCVCVCVCVCVWLVTSVVSNSLQCYGLQPARLLCPWKFSGQNTRVGCHFLLLGILLTLEPYLCLLHCRQILYLLSHWGSLKVSSVPWITQNSFSINSG